MTQGLSDEFDAFVEQLSNKTLLTSRQAEVYTLRECGYGRQDIVQTLDISEGAVDSHWSKAREQVSKLGSQVQGHFYDTRTTRIPLLWEEDVSTSSLDGPSYVVSTPLVSVPNQLERSMLEETRMLSIYEDFDIEHPCVFKQGQSVQHIPFRTNDDLYQVFSNCFESPLTDESAKQLNGLWRVYGQDTHSSASEFFTTIFGGQRPDTTPEFYVELESEIRFTFLHEFYSTSSLHINFGFEVGTNRPVTLDQYTDELNWISIVGAIGSGKSFTQDMIVSQIAEQSGVEIIEFDPLQGEGSEYVYCEADVTRFDETEVGDVDELIDDFVEYVQERIEDSDEICIVVDQAHYLLHSHPDVFKEFAESAQSEDITLVTSTQTVAEYFEVDEFDELFDTALWIFHRLEMQEDHQKQLGVSSVVKNLASGSASKPYAESILKEANKPGLLCAVTPSTKFDIRKY